MITPSPTAYEVRPDRCSRTLEEQRGRDEHAGERLGHEQAVVEPEVRVDRGDRRREHARAPAADLGAEQRHQRHEQRTDERDHETVLAEAARAELGRRRQDDDEQGWMAGARAVGAVPVRVEEIRGDEAVPVGNEVGLLAVEDRVVIHEEARLRRLVHEHDHRDPGAGPEERDGEDREQEPPGEAPEPASRGRFDGRFGGRRWGLSGLGHAEILPVRRPGRGAGA